MLATQIPFTPYDSILKSSTNTIRNNVYDMQTSGRHYVTPDVNRQLNQLTSGVEHMHFDTDLLKSSPEWAEKCNLDRLSTEKRAASKIMDSAANTVSEVKCNMTKENVSHMQDNQVREMHHWAMNSLQGAQQDLGPYKEESVSRLKQFCDHVGVTDRYTGYRNNLNRGRQDPVRMGFKWLDTKPNQYNTMDWQRASASTKRVTWEDSSRPDIQMARSKTAPVVSQRIITANPTEAFPKFAPPSAKSIQERCGINTVFPGRTEYMVRYGRPNKCTVTGFSINPKPDFLLHGRPLAEMQFYRDNTEYQFRYEWPDSQKITKLPWLRK